MLHKRCFVLSICNDGNEIVIIISHDWLNLIQYNVMIHKLLLRGKWISWGLRSLMMSVAKKKKYLRHNIYKYMPVTLHLFLLTEDVQINENRTKWNLAFAKSRLGIIAIYG